MISRRRFLAFGPVVAATAAAGPGSILKDILPRALAAGPEGLTRSRFAPHVNSAFQVKLGPLQHADVRLVEVADLPAPAGAGSAPGDREGQFSLIFRGPHEPRLAQNTYTVEHAEMGAFALFLVPVGDSADGRHYQAIFNRIGAAPAREA